MPLFHQALTDFIFVEDIPKHSDIIFIPGGSCGEIAENAAVLYHRGLAPRILVSGKYSILTGHFDGPASPKEYIGSSFSDECAFLTRVLTDHQVPLEAILQERQASYTYENAIYSRRLTDQMCIDVQTAILSCQAYHARRCLLYYQLLYPDTRFFVCPAVTRGITRSNWYKNPEYVDLVLGEVERCGSQFHQILKNTL